jgi:hypothetical protein
MTLRWLFLIIICTAASPAYATLVSGHVTDSATGLPISNAAVEYTEDFFAGSGSTFTDSDGYYEFDIPSGGAGDISASADGYLQQDQSFDVDNDPLTIDFALVVASSISGTITDSLTLQPIANANVSLLDTSNAVVNTVQTDENGVYVLSDVQPGQYGVCVIDATDVYLDSCYANMTIGSDGVAHFTTLTVSAGSVFSGIDVALSIGATLSGLLSDSYFGVVIADQTMDFQLFSENESPIGNITLVTDDDGKYTLTGLAPGNYYLAAGANFTYGSPNGAYTSRIYGGGECGSPTVAAPCPFDTATKIAVPKAGADDINFSLFPAYIATGKVTDAATGQGIPGVTLYACDTPFIVGVSATAVTDANGDYVLAHILGDQTGVQTEDAIGYLNILWPDTLIPADSNCNIPAPASALQFTMPDQILTGINFSLGTGAAIVGFVGATDSVDPVAAKVAIISTDGQSLNVVQTLTTNADGTFQTIGNFVGDYYVMAYFDNGTDCQIYPFAACGTPWNVLDPTSADFSNAVPLTLGPGVVESEIYMNLNVEIFSGNFE